MAVAGAVAMATVILYLGVQRMQAPSDSATQPGESSQRPPPPVSAPAPAIRYPIVSGNHEPDGEAALWNAVIGLIADRSLQALLNRQDFVHRVVATVDNLPRSKLPLRQMPVDRMHENITVIGQGDDASLSRENYKRYERYVQLMQAFDTHDVVAIYVRHYPLFQQAFRELGYSDRYFNDRLVEAIDDLLATPDLPDQPALDRPKVLYIFQDPKLEALSAGQKIMIRIGPLNAAKAKAKLRAIRKEVVSQGWKQ